MRVLPYLDTPQSCSAGPLGHIPPHAAHAAHAALCPQAIFRCIGTTSRTFAEFGVEGGSECSTRWLRQGHGWTGVGLEVIQF